MAIVDADGSAFEDRSKDRTFSLLGKSFYDDGWLEMKETNSDVKADLYVGIGALGSSNTDAESVHQTLLNSHNENTIIKNINFTSKMAGNTIPLTCCIVFEGNTTVHLPLDLSKSYSDTIS